METLVAPVPMESHNHSPDNNSTDMTKTAKRPAPLAGGCRIEGFVRVKKVISILVIASIISIQLILKKMSNTKCGNVYIANCQSDPTTFSYSCLGKVHAKERCGREIC